MERVRAIGLPGDLFHDASEKLVAIWRVRAAPLYPPDLRAPHSRCVSPCLPGRSGHRPPGRGGAPCQSSPVVGEGTLNDLVREARANERAFNQRIRVVLRSSYSAYYRRMLPRILSALEFRSNNTACRSVIDAIELLRRYSDRPSEKQHYALTERVPREGVVPPEWRNAVVNEHEQVERIPYELCVLRALRDAIRRREIWVVGCNRGRNPEEDLPAGVDENRDLQYAEIRQPTDSSEFIARCRPSSASSSCP